MQLPGTNRKVLHEALQDKSAAMYEPIQLKESRSTIVSCGRHPQTFQAQFGRYAASVIMTVGGWARIAIKGQS